MIRVRPLTPGDEDALTALVARCSPRTRHQRFHGVVDRIPPAYLRRCLSGEHATVVAEAAGLVIGFGSVGPVFEEPDVHEIAVLVEDDWQGRGVGRALASALFAVVPVDVVRLEMCRSPLARHLAATLPVLRTRHLGCDTLLDVDVPAVRRAAAGSAPSPRSSTGTRPGVAAPS